MYREKLNKVLKDALNNTSILDIFDNKIEEFVLNIFSINDHAREVYYHPYKLTRSQTNIIIEFIQRYTNFIKNLQYKIHKQTSNNYIMYFHHINSLDYSDYIQKHKHTACKIEYIFRFNNKRCIIRDNYTTKKIKDRRIFQKKINKFCIKYKINLPYVGIILIDS